jgi:YD repeat-containing protein
LMGPGGLVYTGNGTSGLYAANAALYLTAKQCKDAKTTIVHDLLGRQVKITDAMGFEESMSYDGLGNKKTYTAKSNTSDNSNAGGLYKYE